MRLRINNGRLFRYNLARWLAFELRLLGRKLDQGDAAHVHCVAGLLLQVAVLLEQFRLVLAAVSEITFAGHDAEHAAQAVIA